LLLFSFEKHANRCYKEYGQDVTTGVIILITVPSLSHFCHFSIDKSSTPLPFCIHTLLTARRPTVVMSSTLFNSLVLLVLSIATLISAQAPDTGYSGYLLSRSGDPGSVIYATANTPADVPTIPDPDVYLNATVHVGEIDLQVLNLTAKINIDAQVLKLLQFNAGVDVSIDKVNLLIQNVSANVLLEARLENLVRMINDTLNSLDLNPALASIGQTVSSVVSSATPSSTGGSTVAARSFDLDNNILYSINDYSGNTHTNRILKQDGGIVDQSLDNHGNIHGEQLVGTYLKDMTFNGYNQSVVRDGQNVHEVEFVYTPFEGISVVSAIFINEAGAVVATQVLSESSAGGSSSIGGL
jgi:hypothetical protein